MDPWVGFDTCAGSVTSKVFRVEGFPSLGGIFGGSG